MKLLPGCLAFGLFFLGDWNDWKWGKAPLRMCFPAGFLLLAEETARLAWNGAPVLPSGARGAFYVLAAIFLALLIHALFFALPAGDSYARQAAKRRACTTGVYALCRHPGVLWFAGLYLCLWAAAGLPLAAAAAFCALDVLLVIFEDLVVFPARLEGYDDYRRTTPFLLPNRGSLRACLKRY